MMAEAGSMDKCPCSQWTLKETDSISALGMCGAGAVPGCGGWGQTDSRLCKQPLHTSGEFKVSARYWHT